MTRLAAAAYAAAMGVVLACFAAAALSIAPASAASLPMAASSNPAFAKDVTCGAGYTNSSPTMEAEGAQGTSSSREAVQLTDIPAGCANVDISVALYSSAGVLVAEGSDVLGNNASGQLSVGVSPNYDESSVSIAIVTIDGWIFVALWNGQQPPLSCIGLDALGNPVADPCTVSVAGSGEWWSNGYHYKNIQFKTSTTAALWQITIDLSDPAYGGFSTVEYLGTYQNLALANGYSCSQLPTVIVVEANPNWNSNSGELIVSDDPSYAQGTALCS